MLNSKKIITGSLASAILVTGIVGASLVNAQDDPTATPDVTEEVAPEVTETVVPGYGGRRGFGGERGGMFGQDFDGRGGRGDRFGGNFRDGQIMATLGDTAELLQTYTGLTQDELRTEIMNGATIAELITANDQSVEDFVTEAAAPAFERIDAAVEEGRIDEEQAATLKENVVTNLTDRLENNAPRRNNPVLRQLDGEVLTLAETYTGLTAAEMREEIIDGATLADLITANDGDVDAFVAEVVAIREARIDERVAIQKANLESTITSLVNGEMPTLPAIETPESE